MMRKPLVMALLAGLTLAACGGGDFTADETTATTAAPPTTEEVTTIPPQVPKPIVQPTEGGKVQTGEVPQPILDTILSDAAERTGLESDALEVVLGQFVIWSDGSLGCPEPGKVYTQALVEGYRVVVDAGGRLLDYRVTESGSFILCEQGITPSGLGSIGTAPGGNPDQ